MSNPEPHRLYRADLDCILGVGESDYETLAWVKNIFDKHGDFRSLVGVMRVAESYRDWIPFTLSELPTDDTEELIKLAYYSFGYRDEKLQPATTIPRHRTPAAAACNQAEEMFVVSASKKPSENTLNGIVYTTEAGESVIFQKGLREKTALGLGVISIKSSDGSEVIYPEGWIYEVTFDIETESDKRVRDFHTAIKALDRDINGHSSQPIKSVSSLRPIRPSTFTVKSPKAVAIAKGYNAKGVDLSKYNIDWFIDKLA